MNKTVRKALELLEGEIGNCSTVEDYHKGMELIEDLKELIKANGTKPELRMFTEADWYAFSGARKWKDESEPWIAEVEENNLIILVDADGVNVSLFDGENVIQEDIEIKVKPLALAIGNKLLEELKTLNQDQIRTYMKQTYDIEMREL
jgi:hypothetical protein